MDSSVKGASRDQILGGESLISRLFRTALKLEPQFDC